MYAIHAPRASRVLIPFLVGCLVLLFAPQFSASASSITPSHTLRPAISTSCPASGTANAASMPSMTLGTDPTIVYIVNEGTPSQPTAGTLKRYDVVTGNKVEILKMADALISEAQVSANGQWLLFVAHVSGQVKLQLVRMDGQFLQTLYCGNPDQVEWNQQLVVFEDAQGTLLLNMTTGALQVELSPSSNPPFTQATGWTKTASMSHCNSWMVHRRAWPFLIPVKVPISSGKTCQSPLMPPVPLPSVGTSIAALMEISCLPVSAAPPAWAVLAPDLLMAPV